MPATSGAARRRRGRRTQAARSALSGNRLMEATLALIAERGYHHASLQAIGARAGYSRGLVSHRFGSKEGLVWAIFERTLADWRATTLVPRVGDRVGAEA